jgi:hypothetical protein
MHHVYGVVCKIRIRLYKLSHPSSNHNPKVEYHLQMVQLYGGCKNSKSMQRQVKLHLEGFQKGVGLQTEYQVEDQAFAP